MADTVAPTRSPAQVEGAGLILDHIRHQRAQTTSSLAALMGMARSTVMQRLDVLSGRQLILSEVTSTGNRGRPASRSVFNPTAAHVLAAQVGLSGTRLAVTDLDGRVLGDRLIDVDLPSGPDSLLERLQAGLDDLTAAAGLEHGQLAGVGIGLPRTIELLSYLRSLKLSGSDWDREHFATVLRGRYRVPVYLDTDVNLLALAERAGSWPDAEVFVCAKLGTLIDAAVVVNGLPLRGASRMAGELAHIKVSGPPEPCTCGGIGCLDAVASGAALVRRMRAEGLEVEHISDVVDLANDGVGEAVRALRTAGRHIGEALATVVNLLNPDAIAVWGYLAEAESVLFSGIREGLYAGALPDSSESVTLFSAALGELAGVLGAARLVTDRVLEPEHLDVVLGTGSWDVDHPAA